MSFPTFVGGFLILSLVESTYGILSIPEYEGYPCPDQCLCLSEIQVLCNTGNLLRFPTNIPNVTQELSINGQGIQHIPKYAFKGLKELKKVTLDNNKITNIEPFAFKGLQNVDEISLRWNPLETIPGFAFAGIRNISSIYLGFNKIKTISGYAFAGSEHINMLVINDNPNIKKIESFAFAGLKFVQFLLISSTIKHIEPDAFNGLEGVEQLKLEYLNIKKTHQNTFRGLKDCNAVTIGNSDLGEVEDGAWAGMINVTQVNILSSKIDQISDISVIEDSNVKSIRLAENHVLDVSASIWGPDFAHTIQYGGLASVQLFKNHLPCSCDLSFVLDELSEIVKDLEAMEEENFCISPHMLNGKTIREMQEFCRRLQMSSQRTNHVSESNSRLTNERSSSSKSNVFRKKQRYSVKENSDSASDSDGSGSINAGGCYIILAIVLLLFSQFPGLL